MSMLSRINFNNTAAFKALSEHHSIFKEQSIKNLFQDTDRFKKFSIKFEDIPIETGTFTLLIGSKL